MTKTRTMPTRLDGPTRDQEFHQKLEKGARTASLHRQKVRQDEREAQRAAPDRGHTRSRAAHPAPEEPAKSQTKAVPGKSDSGSHPGALLKR
jgi:hypothetical protein